jgi:hypothetical protein
MTENLKAKQRYSKFMHVHGKERSDATIHLVPKIRMDCFSRQVGIAMTGVINPAIINRNLPKKKKLG